MLCNSSVDGPQDRLSLPWTSTGAEAAMSTLDELIRVWGWDDNPKGLELTDLADVLEFSLTANERQSTSVTSMSPDGRNLKRIRLLGKDVNHGVVIVRLLGQEVHPLVHLQTTRCLANLADSPQHRVKIASYARVLDALTRQLGNVDRAKLQEETARCLENLALNQENHMTMASSSVLDPLLRLLTRNASQQLLQLVVRCLTNLAVSDNNKVRIGNYPGLLDALATLLDKPGSFNVHKYITRCLTNLAGSQEMQLKIVSDFPVVLNGLMRLLDGTSDGQLHSLQCLIAVSDHYQRNQIAIASHSGVLDALLRLLRHNWATTDRIKVQAEAARCLLKLLSAPENLLTIASHVGAFDALVRCLEPRSRTREVQTLAIDCFRRLAAAPENHLKIVSFAGAVSALLNQLAHAENSEAQERAAWCLSRLATSMETKVAMTHNPGLLKTLVGALNRSNSALLEPAIQCLMKLSQSDELKVRVRITFYHGMIDALVKVLGSRLDVVLQHTTDCLSRLALSPQNAQEIISHPKVLNSLMTLLQGNTNSDVLEYTAKCLTNLACSEESQVKMASVPGMLDVLVQALDIRDEESRKVQEQVVKCLAQLSAPPESHEQFASIPGLHDAVRRLALDDVHPRAQKQAELCVANLNLSLAVAETNARVTSPSRLSADQQTWQELRTRDSLSDPDDWYADPITWDTMCDPVKCSDGVTYDRWTLINNGIRKSPFDRSLINILCDDIDVRRRLFRASSQLEAKFRALRKSYRDKALQSARALQFEDAIEKLNTVLMWAPSDTECRTELDKMLKLLDTQSSPREIQSPNSSFAASPARSENSFNGSTSSVRTPELRSENSDGSTSALRLPERLENSYGSQLVPHDDSPRIIPRNPSSEREDETSRIPVVTHDVVMEVREREGARKALVIVIFVFSVYFAVFLFV
ncbi:unnamed protein product [Calypogeia fissa]